MTALFTQLFDDPVMAMWFLLSAFFFFLALFSLRVWFDVRGVRGIAIFTLTVACGLLAMLLGVARSPEARIPWATILILLRPLFTLMAISCGVIVDLWAADHNDHRSFTTVTYEKFKALTYERHRKSTHHGASLHEMGG